MKGKEHTTKNENEQLCGHLHLQSWLVHWHHELLPILSTQSSVSLPVSH